MNVNATSEGCQCGGPGSFTGAKLTVGMTASFSKRISEQDIERFAVASGDSNPVHLDEEFAKASAFRGRVAHGLLSASAISAALANHLPGPGTVYLTQSLRFRAPVRPGDLVTAEVEVLEVNRSTRHVRLATRCTTEGGVVIEGEATVLAPASSESLEAVN